MFSSIVPASIRRRLHKRAAATVEPTVPTHCACCPPFPKKRKQMDVCQQLAVDFGEQIRQLITRVTSAPTYATPSITLEEFIAHILRVSPAPPLAGYGAITIVDWVTRHDKSPLSSSSPHHLFFSSYQYMVQGVWSMHQDDGEWLPIIGGFIPEKEVMAMKVEVGEVMRAMPGPEQEQDRIVQQRCRRWSTHDLRAGL